MREIKLKDIDLNKIEKVDDEIDYTQKIIEQVNDESSREDLQLAISGYFVQVLLNNKEEIYKIAKYTNEKIDYLKNLIIETEKIFKEEYQKRIKDPNTAIYELNAKAIQVSGHYISSNNIVEGSENFIIALDYILIDNMKSIFIKPKRPTRYTQYISITDIDYREERKWIH